MKKLNYLIWIILITIIYTLFNLRIIQAPIAILITAITSYLCWEYFDIKRQKSTQLENVELQVKIQSSSKDAHLKNKQLLTIATSIPFPLILLDAQGNIVMHNEVQEVCDKEKILKTFQNNSLAFEAKEFLKDAFIIEKKIDQIITINEIEFQAIGVPILAKGLYRGCLILFQDISKTVEKEKMQKRFIADASHELKTPISIIKGMVEILNRENFDDTLVQKEFMQQIEKEVNRMECLIKDLLQLSRFSLSNTLVNREMIDIHQVINKACDSLEKLAKNKGIQIEKQFTFDEYLYLDEMKMSQLIMNLLNNAISYSDHGTITITSQIIINNYELHIHDQGCGIDPQEHEKIFERFYRVDVDRSRKSGGSGLGLAIVKSIVEAHKGSILIESALNKGCTFIIRLPIVHQ